MGTSENEILLSFIIPVYNVEAYLRECVDSILQQITPNCEIVLIDDGSTDASREICQRYAEENSPIYLIRKENGGLSSARNAGISAANGKYITFVDSDDKISPHSVDAVLQWIKAGGADLCFLQTVKLYSDGTQEDLGERISREHLRLAEKKVAVSYLASRPKYPGSAWAKLFKREFLIENNLHFPYDRRLSEDLGFLRDCILRSRSMDALEIPYYQYRQNRKGSITNKLSSRNFYDLLSFVIDSVEILTVNKKAKDAISRYAMGFVAYEYVILLLRYGDVSPEEKQDAMSKLQAFRWTLRYARSTKGRMVAMVCAVFGVKRTAALLSKYQGVSKK